MRPTILTIDDSKGLRPMAEKALSAYDCEAHKASNGFNGYFAIERASSGLLG